MEIDGMLTSDAVPGGTCMHWAWDLQPRGVVKLMAPIVARMGRRRERTIWTNVKQLLEARPALM